jgi:hypothetical protein
MYVIYLVLLISFKELNKIYLYLLGIFSLYLNY